MRKLGGSKKLPGQFRSRKSWEGSSSEEEGGVSR